MLDIGLYKLKSREMDNLAEANKQLREALSRAAIDNAKLRFAIVVQERVNEELEQELAILKHQTKPDKIIFNPPSVPLARR